MRNHDIGGFRQTYSVTTRSARDQKSGSNKRHSEASLKDVHDRSFLLKTLVLAVVKLRWGPPSLPRSALHFRMAEYIAVADWRLGVRLKAFLSIGLCGKSITYLRDSHGNQEKDLRGCTAPPLFEKINKLVRRLQPGLCAGLPKRVPHEDGEPAIAERPKGVFICEVVT